MDPENTEDIATTPVPTKEVEPTIEPTVTPEIKGNQVNVESNLYVIADQIKIEGYNLQIMAWYDDRTMLLVYQDDNAKILVTMYDVYTGVIIKQRELEIEMNLDQIRVLENGALDRKSVV